MNTNTAAMALIARIAALQNGVEKNGDKACWHVWDVIKASFAKLQATIPGCATRFDTAPAAATPEKLAVITAKSPKLIYFTHNDSKTAVLNTSNRSVVCKVIAPDAEREAFATHAADMMRRDGLTVDVATDYRTLSVLTYYEPSAVAVALQNNTAPAPAMPPQPATAAATVPPAEATNTSQVQAEPRSEQETSSSSSPVRIQLDYPADYVKDLDELMKETKSATRKELVSNAITAFQWAAKAKRAGRIVVSLDEKTGNAKELVMPALENISAR